MDVIAHHLPAIYAVLAVVVVPGVIVILWIYAKRRKERLSREAMRRGNILHRNWLEQSKHMREP